MLQCHLWHHIKEDPLSLFLMYGTATKVGPTFSDNVLLFQCCHKTNLQWHMYSSPWIKSSLSSVQTQGLDSLCSVTICIYFEVETAGGSMMVFTESKFSSLKFVLQGPTISWNLSYFYNCLRWSPQLHSVAFRKKEDLTLT